LWILVTFNSSILFISKYIIHNCKPISRNRRGVIQGNAA
jgi:hypothetical protein